jgi:hypothetical protein
MTEPSWQDGVAHERQVPVTQCVGASGCFLDAREVHAAIHWSLVVEAPHLGINLGDGMQEWHDGIQPLPICGS